MRMRNLRFLNKLKRKEYKKSHLLIFGSLLVFMGFFFLSFNHLAKLREQLFSDMLLSMYGYGNQESKVKAPIAKNVSDGTVYNQKNIDFSKYLGVLSIPKIGLRRGFYNLDSKYNSIEYNVTVVKGSTMPDVAGGNLMLMAHSGDAYISYFAYLYRLNIGDNAFVTYNGRDYKYGLVNVYNVPKNGKVKINRNFDRTTLTLITCTKDDSTKQTVYIFELVG
ncbi:MAG: sortase [Bacilli bacterium]|nr:sortase [Bacilli bacterium]